ncbi:hypothetical protein [Pseudoduganella buxea]|uniref:Uncharacterized protein n=1 Tax=Pseudoduganella buxea TaxID=1949069 RepID=A0A6I3T1K0_9BURK|nr:hypothetical protein [Pseudoduganella buxea]MTV55373.1 hypothetical protein [Pseudoduganella buxea]GGC13804.1 hypothetical protein GCM10011572_38990 [Pseudoduganella buxea]
MPRKAACLAVAAMLQCLGPASLGQPAIAAPASDAAAYIARQGWTPFDSKVRPRMPAGDLAPLMYYRQGSAVPSCALLARRAGGLDFFEILAAEPGEDYPHCSAIHDGASFPFAGKSYLVVPYTSRDTRDESYTAFFYLSTGKDGRHAVENALNDAVAPGLGRLAASDGIRGAKADLIRRSEPALQLLERDFIADGGKAFAILKDKAGHRCTFVVETKGDLARYGSELFGGGRCRGVLASGRFDTPAATYFLGLFRADGPATKLALFAVPKSGGAAQAEPGLAAEALRAGRTGDIRTAKAFLRRATASHSPQ